ncbi:173_t:CDS:2, partial [Entrophospora sp. SA101]
MSQHLITSLLNFYEEAPGEVVTPKVTKEASSYESSEYKFRYDNGNVFIVDMCTSFNRTIARLFQSPDRNRSCIAPDVAVYPNKMFIPGPPNPGPPRDTMGTSTQVKEKTKLWRQEMPTQK